MTTTTVDAARPVWRLRRLAVCAGLVAFAFLQEPGLVAMDTKIDLAVRPADWLARSMHVWNPDGTFGQLQNQTYGYLWPVGPFFAGGDALGLPAWVVQRLWWALLLCVAFLGVVALADRMGVGGPASRLVAGVAFALSPRIITELGPISVEAWPTAIAPWVLVPLIPLARGAPLRRAVCLSGLAVACAGGVNATAVFAVVPLAALWLATAVPVGRRLLALGAWCLAVLAATFWWLVPLFILGRYSPPFMDYIETAGVTTRVTDTVTVLRGASHWLAYGRSWDAGAQLAMDRLPIVATLVVAGLGLAGLARRGMPHRRFLVTGLILGVALVALGHVGTVDGLFAAAQRDFLDGAGAPLRNVHKFDVVLRLPLVLGLAHLVELGRRRAAIAGPGWHRARKQAAVVGAAAVAGIVGVASPAFAVGLPPDGSVREVPGYWREAGAWLDARLGDGRVLVAPGARFPRYTWGSPADEITQPLLDSSWAVRNSIPLTPPTTIRLLDAIESTVATGAGSAGLADVLARSGVQYVLLRSDLDYGASRAVRPVIAQQALDRSAGLRRVAEFGPLVGGRPAADAAVSDQGLDRPVRALAVYEVVRDVEPAVAYDSLAVRTVVGGPESLLDLAAAGQLGDAPTVLAGDRPADFSGPTVLTDGLRRRELTFGLLHDNASATSEAGRRFALGGAVHDYLPAWGDEQAAVVRFRGIETVTASNSWAQAHALTGARPAHQPFAALDGDPATSWRTSPSAPTRQWLQVELDQPRRIGTVHIRFDAGADELPTKVTVSTGGERTTVDSFDGVVTVRLPGVLPAKRVRVTIEEALTMRTGQGRVGIAELTIPGVRAERTIVAPPGPASDQPAPVVVSAAPTVPSCFFPDGAPVCADGVARASEDGGVIDRVVTLPAGADYSAAVWVRSRPGRALDELLDADVAQARSGGLAPAVSVSSTALPDPAVRAGAVLDGDPATAWSPSADDTGAWLKLNWLTPRTITGLRLTTADSVARARPHRITAMGDGGTRHGVVAEDGTVQFDRPLRTDDLTVLFRSAAPVTSFDPYRRRVEALPIAIGEVATLPAGPPVRIDPAGPVSLPCGSGPTLSVGGVERRTAIVATRADLLEGREVPAVLCDSTPVPLVAGPLHVVAEAAPAFAPTRVALVPGSEGGASSGRTPVEVARWDSNDRVVRLDPYAGERVLGVRENTNPGWRATLDGRTLTPIVLDGWQQGWIVPPGLGGEVVLTFAPDRPFRIGLGIGAALLGLLLLGAVVRPGRRRPRHGAVEPGRRPSTLLPIVGGVALVTFGGVPAILMAVAGAVLLAIARLDHPAVRTGWTRAVAWLLPVAAFALAGWVGLDHADRHTAAAPQLLALVAATGLWLSTLSARSVAVAAADGRTRRRLGLFAHRRIGRSNA